MKITRALTTIALLLFVGACGDPQRFTGRTQNGLNDGEANKEFEKKDKDFEPQIPVFYAQTRSARDLEIHKDLVGSPSSLEIFNKTTGRKLEVRMPRQSDNMIKFSLAGEIAYGWNDLMIKSEKNAAIMTKIFKGDFPVFGIATTSSIKNPPPKAGVTPTQSKFIGWLNPLTSIPEKSDGKIQSGFQNIVN